MAKNSAPTPEQVAEAQEILRRDAETKAAAQREAMRPLVELAQSENFQAVIGALESLDPSFRADRSFGPHLHAALVGLEGIRNTAQAFGAPAAPVDAPEAPEAPQP